MNCSDHGRFPYHDFLGNDMQYLHFGARDEPQLSAPLPTYRCAYCDRSFVTFQALGGHHAAHAREMRRQWQQEEKAAASSDCPGSDPRPLNHVGRVTDGGREQRNNLAACKAMPTVVLPPLNAMNWESSRSAGSQHSQLVDYMGVQSQGIGVALWDTKTTDGSSEETFIDPEANLSEENNTRSLEFTLGYSEEIDLTLRL